jgi:hypothetical protein
VGPVAETYAVVWAEGDQPTRTGRLELLDDGFRLRGGVDEAERVVLAADISDVQVGYAAGERLRDMKTVIIRRRGADRIILAAVDGLGGVFEIAQLVAELRRSTRSYESIMVRLPIRPERIEAVRELIRRGPPFRPADIPRLDRHEVFLSEADVVFLFQGRDVRGAVERMARSPGVWRAAVDWRGCLAGRPRVVEASYAWPAEAADGLL